MCKTIYKKNAFHDSGPVGPGPGPSGLKWTQRAQWAVQRETKVRLLKEPGCNGMENGCLIR